MLWVLRSASSAYDGRSMKMNEEKPKLLVIMGSTGSGKSRLSIDLASYFHIEVINADSMQVYNGLYVLTNKVPLNEQKGVAHHLLGTVNPNIEFTAKQFRDSAIPLISDILSRNFLPVIVCSTNYYIQIFLEVITRVLSNYELCKLLPHFSLSSHLQELPKHPAKFIDPTPTANDGRTKHIVPAFAEHFKLEFEFIKDQIRHAKTVGFNFPSIGNPEWIDHLYVGSTVMFKPPADSDNSWTGFALFIVYETYDHDQFVKSGKLEEITFNFSTDKGLQHTIVVQNMEGSEDGQRGQFVIFPRKCFDGKLKEATFLDASVSTNRPDMVVKRCGIHIISKQDTAKFATDLIQTAGEYLLKESKVCPNCKRLLG